MLVLEQLNSAVPQESRPSPVCLLLQQASRCHGPYSPHSNTCTFTTLMHNISSWIPLPVQSDLLSRWLDPPSPTCNWIWDFLTDRPQVVRVGKRVSAQLTVSMGPHRAAALVLHSFHSTHRTGLRTSIERVTVLGPGPQHGCLWGRQSQSGTTA